MGYSEILKQKAYEKFICLSTKVTEELIPVMLKVSLRLSLLPSLMTGSLLILPIKKLQFHPLTVASRITPSKQIPSAILFLKIFSYLLIFGYAGSSLLCGLFSSYCKQGLLSSCRASHCGSFSCGEAGLWGELASVVAAPGL